MIFQDIQQIKNTLSSVWNPDTEYAPRADIPQLKETPHWIDIGVVQDTCNAAGVYKVTLLGKTVLCTALRLCGGQHAGMIGEVSYLPGDNVLISLMEDRQLGYILGAIPSPSAHIASAMNTFWSHSAMTRPDETTLGPIPAMNMETSGFVLPLLRETRNLNATDMDSFFCGSTYGVKLGVDPFSAMLAASDSTGLWVFSDDNFLRLSGYNYQFLSSSRYAYQYNDNGELLDVTNYTLYPWEAYGYYKKPSKVITPIPSKDWQEDRKWKAAYEPEEPEARPFHRISEYRGWLGHGKLSQVSLPHHNVKVAAYSEDTSELPAVLRKIEHVDGTYAVESAKGIFFRKRPLFPSVQPIHVPDDVSTAQGDCKDTDYDFEHKNRKLSGDFICDAGTVECLQWLAGMEDYLSYLFNYKALEPFMRHKRDYLIPEESALSYAKRISLSVGELKTKQFLEAPVPVTWDVDETLTQQKYYPNEAGFGILPDGSVVLYDGYGASLTMGGGSITLSAPGDIWIKSGRNTIAWSGRDVEIKAHDSMDLSTTKDGIRIKAEEQLSLLGGNAGGEKGVLIESRGKSKNYDFSNTGDGIKMGGIALKATNSTCSITGDTLYLRSVPKNSGDGIILDSGKGTKPIYSLASQQTHYLDQSIAWNFGNPKGGSVKKSIEFTEQNVSFSENMLVSGSITVGSRLDVKGVIQSDAHIYTVGAKSSSGMVSPIDGEAKTALEKNLRESKEYSDKTLPQVYRDRLLEELPSLLYDSKKVGNEDVLLQTGFSFRTQDEYNTPNFLLYEDRWQSITTTGIRTWEETKVTTHVEDSYPYPGKEYYEGKPCYVSQELKLFDVENGYSVDRRDNEDYASPEFGKQEKKAINQYKII